MKVSGRRDLNPGPLPPQGSALPLRYAPIYGNEIKLVSDEILKEPPASIQGGNIEIKILRMSRREKIERAMRNRQKDLALYLYKVSNPHNLSAIIRTAEAVGVPSIYFTMEEDVPFEISSGVTMGAHKWVNLHEVEEPDSFLEEMKRKGFNLVATALRGDAIHFRNYDFTQKTLIIMGNESRGLDEWVIEKADYTIIIPMYGMVQSLNVSVAAAVILYEALRQREEKGKYPG